MNAPRRSNEERRETTRDALSIAAVALIAERGIEATTLADVAERAGLSKGALVHHYASKELLIDAALERSAALVATRFAAAWEPATPPLARLGRCLDALARLAAERPVALRVLCALASQGHHDERLGGLVRARLDAIEATFCEALTLTLAELGASLRCTPETLAHAVVTSVVGAAMPPGSAPDVVALKVFWEAALFAMLTPETRC